MVSSRDRALALIDRATARDRALIRARRGGGQGMADTPDKVQALVAAARALESLGAPYALIGGVAVGIHSGVPRATLDTDLAVLSTLDRGTVSRGLAAGGFRLTGEFHHSMNFRHPSGEPVQVVFDQGFDDMIRRAERFLVAGTSVAIVQKPDLIAMKERAAADPERRRSKALRDRADVELLRGDVPGEDDGW